MTSCTILQRPGSGLGCGKVWYRLSQRLRRVLKR